MRALNSLLVRRYHRSKDVLPAQVSGALWSKSSFSAMNGNCVEIARLAGDRVGVRDTKDHGAGPVLVFDNGEWNAFLRAAKSGEFDQA
jgi:hypothetical protein